MIDLKLSALRDHQREKPAPFVWVDDHITETEHLVARCLKVPSLIIAPNTRVGLTNDNLEEIEEFAKQYN